MRQCFVMASWLLLVGARKTPSAVPFRSFVFFSGSFTPTLGIATASVEALQRKCGKEGCWLVVGGGWWVLVVGW